MTPDCRSKVDMTDRHNELSRPMPNQMQQRPVPTFAGQSEPMMAMTPKEIISIIRRHILMIIICTIAGVVIGVGAYAGLLVFNPQYTAQALIKVLPPESANPLSLEERSSNKDTYLLFRQSKAELMLQQDLLENLLKSDVVRKTSWFRQFEKGDDIDITDALKKLKKKLGVSADREKEYIRVSMTCKKPKEAASIVNQLIELYLKQQYEQATKIHRDKLATAREQEESLRSELRAAETSLTQIRKANPDIAEFTNTDEDFRHSIKVRRDSVEIQESNLEAQISQVEAQIATLEVRATGDYDDVVREQVENDPIAISARQRIVLLRPELSRRIAKLGENHRSVRQAQEELRQAEQELSDRQNYIAEIQRQANLQNAEDAKTVLMSQKETYRKQLQQAQIEQKQLDELRAEYSRFTEIRDKRIANLEELTKYIRDINLVINDPQVAKLASMGPAPEPREISSPKIIIFGPAGFMLGLMAGFGLAFLIELSNDTLRSPSEVMKNLRVPLLGMVCHQDEDQDIEDIDQYKVISQAPFSITSEMYRQLKGNIKLANIGAHKTIAITSGAPGEGKTKVASNLCTAFVAEGRKVLFVDTNFRRPTSAKLFPKESQSGEHTDYGLSNLLMRQCEADQIVRHSSIENLDVVDSGPLPSNPAELLGSPEMKRFLERTSQIYDYVILDCPPILVSDAKSLVAMSDSTILVFNATMTKKGAAQRTLRELMQVNAPVCGSVLVDVRSLKGGYFHENIQTYQDYQRVELAKQK